MKKAVSPEDIAMATKNVNQGYTPEESTELIQALGELQQGATPEELRSVGSEYKGGRKD